MEREIERLYGSTKISELYKKRWSDIITQKEHILTQFIINKYKCDRVEEIPLTLWEWPGNLILVNNENEIFAQLYWAEKIYQVKPSSTLDHRIAPPPLIYFITLKSTYRDDKILACVYEPAIRVYIKGKEFWSYKIFPITHKADHIIGMIAWIPIHLVKEEHAIPAHMRKIGAIGFYDIFY